MSKQLDQLILSDTVYEVFNVLNIRALNMFDMQEEILKHALIYVLENSQSNALPYHNFQHTVTLVQSLISLIAHEPDFMHRQQETNFCLLLAGIFHDYNHSGGHKPDSENIAEAITGLQSFLGALSEKLNSRINTEENEVDLLENTMANYLNSKGIVRIFNITSNIIKATEYPFVILDEDLTIPQKYIRDADMSSIFTECAFQTNVIGLYTELKNKFKDLTLPVFCGWQEKFLTDLAAKGFYTDTFNKRYKEELNHTIQFVSSMKARFEQYHI